MWLAAGKLRTRLAGNTLDDVFVKLLSASSNHPIEPHFLFKRELASEGRTTVKVSHELRVRSQRQLTCPMAASRFSVDNGIVHGFYEARCHSRHQAQRRPRIRRSVLIGGQQCHSDCALRAPRWSCDRRGSWSSIRLHRFGNALIVSVQSDSLLVNNYSTRQLRWLISRRTLTVTNSRYPCGRRAYLYFLCC